MNKELKTETKVSLKDYKNIVKRFPYKFMKRLIIAFITIILLSLITLVPPDPMPIDEVIFVIIILIGATALILKLIDVAFSRYKYERLVNYNPHYCDYKLNFKDDYVEKNSPNIKQKIRYTDIWKLKEYEDCFYILLNKKDITVVLKNNCSEELIDFIRNIKINNNKSIKTKANKDSKSNNNNIRIFLIILFILTIASLWMGLGISFLLTTLAKVPQELFTNYMWGMFICLPIPLLSIILGFIYKRKGIKCTKNIVGGFIIGFLLILYGSFSFIFNYQVDYNEVYSYEKIVGLELPHNGIYNKIVWDESYLMNHTSNSIKFTDTKEINEFNKNIEKSDKWITKNEIGSYLNMFVPKTLNCNLNESCYYSVYIEELDNYNTVPTETGVYNVHAMMYNSDISTLKIEQYVYNFSK